jgi:cyanophycin synthetase
VLPTIPGGFQRVTESTEHLKLIRRAARRRGLTVRKIGKTTYFYDGRLPVGGMTSWVPTLVGRRALRISRSKDLTKQMLDAAGVPTPTGIAVGPDDFDVALAHVTAAAGPSVLKPVTGYGGAGITCGITGEVELRRAWEIATEAAGPDPSFVLEQQIDGIDIRAYVVGRRVVAATTRLNAHVVGDGSRSLGELVDLKQRLRNENVFLAKRPIVVDSALLASNGHAMHDVPADGEVIVLNSIANQHVGGENVDVTDLVHPDLLRLATDATRAIPGLGLAGVDLMTPSIDSVDGAVVLEVNVQANIRVHHTPAYGTPRDVAGAIVDEMIATAGAPARSPKGANAGRSPGFVRRAAQAARRRLGANRR